MENTLYRLSFNASTAMSNVESVVALALMTIEDLHGEIAARLDIGYTFDADKRQCVIDARTPAGRNLSRILVGMLKREFGDTAFHVERLESQINADRHFSVAA